MRVAVVDPEPAYPDLLRPLGVQLVQPRDADVLLGRPDLVAEQLDGGCRPRWVQSTWAGVRPLVAAARTAGVPVAGLKGIFGPLISEYVFAWLLADVRASAGYAAAQVQREWLTQWPTTLRDRLLTVIGAGSIGAQVAATGRHFGMRVRGVGRDATPRAAFDESFATHQVTASVAGADYVVACLPDTPATERLLDARVFAAMRAAAVFINVGRAATVDHAALVAALTHERLRAAVLDVLPVEPLPAEHALWRVANLTITPHVAGVSYPADVVRVFADNLRRWQRGAPLQALVDLHHGY